MTILKHELGKLLTRRTVLILLLLIVINPLLQLYTIKTPNEDGYSLADYSRVYREVSFRDADEISAILEERKNNIAVYSEYFLCRRVSEEAESVLAYEDYLDTVEKKAGEIAILSAFVGDDGYAVENAEKTGEVYRKLRGTRPEVQDPMPLLNITDNEITDYLAVVILFILAINLIFREKNEDQLKLLRTTANGRRKLMAAKVAAMFVAVVAVIAALYGANAIVSRCVFGTMDLSSPLQSLYQYRTSPFAISLGGYLIRYFAAKILTCFLLGTFFMLMSAVFGNIVFVLTASAVPVLVEGVLHAKISATHFLAILKYANVTYGIKTGGMFSDYVNLNVFGTPVNSWWLYWIPWLLATVAVSWFVINYLASTHETKAVSVRKMSLRVAPERHTSVFLHECYKMLVPGKCLIILVLFGLFVIWWNPAARVSFDSAEEVYYKDYMDSFYGPLDSERRGMIDAEKARFERLSVEIAEDLAQGKSGYYIDVKYKSDLNRQDGFNRVIEHVDYLESVPGGWLFFDKGYDILTNGENSQNRDIMQAFVYVILLIAVTFGIFGLDYRYSEMRILRTTYRGRRRLPGIKCVLGAACALLVFAMVYLVHMQNIFGAYGAKGLDAPAASMEHLAQFSPNVSVQQYLWIILLMRLVGGLLIIAAVALLFRWLKNGITVIIACVVIFLLPLVLVALGAPGAQYVLCNPLLLGNVF